MYALLYPRPALISSLLPNQTYHRNTITHEEINARYTVQPLISEPAWRVDLDIKKRVHKILLWKCNAVAGGKEPTIDLQIDMLSP